jgi:hypothetical protein
VYGKPKPPMVIHAEWTEEDPRTDALVSIAASMERFVVAAESVAAMLERAEQRVLPDEETPELGRAD